MHSPKVGSAPLMMTIIKCYSFILTKNVHIKLMT